MRRWRYSAYSSHSRNYSANASWAPRDWFSFDASYMKLHLDTLGGIAYFAGAGRATLQTGNSLYSQQRACGELRRAVRGGASERTYTSDTRSRRIRAMAARRRRPGVTDPDWPALFAGVQTFPLSYQSPLARLSVRITPKLRWNLGYQFYNYHEQFQIFGYYQNFHATHGIHQRDSGRSKEAHGFPSARRHDQHRPIRISATVSPTQMPATPQP